MQKTKHWLMTIAMLLGSLTASAYDFEVGDICYYITSNADLTVEVMYCDYSNIRGISIPSTVVYNDKTYCVTSIGDNAFQGCSKLSSVDIPESVTSIGNSAFSGCSSLTSITIPESVTSIGSNAFYRTAWYNKQPDGVIYINKILYKYKGTMPENTSIKVKEGTVCISSYAFGGCSGLISITIPGSVTSIGRNAFNGTAWYNNQPDGVIYIGKVLYQYKGSMPANTSIEVKEGTVSISPYAFSDYNSLTSITIPKSVTSIDFGHEYSSATTFYACNLTSISVAEGNPCYDSRNNCNAIIESKSNTLVLGCRTTIIPEGITAIGDHAFDGFLRGGDYYSIVIPEGVTSLGAWAFANCSRLTSITLPEGVTSIGARAFADCSRLTSITLPESMTIIEYSAFHDCRSLTSITCHAATPPTCDSGSFSDVNTSIPVYVPAVSVADYQAAEVWKEFTNFVGMETGIADVIVGEDADAPIYNMNGMRIRNTLEHLPAGIYIKNGKKFMVM